MGNDGLRYDYLPELVETGLIEDERALGVARKIIDEGVGRLTENQWHVFLKYGVGKVNYVSECDLCSMEVPWSEMLNAVWFYEDNLCSYCRHKLEKEGIEI